MKLFIKILVFILAIFSTNICEAKIILTNNLVVATKYVRCVLESKSESIQILENDFDVICKSESNLVDYKNLAKCPEDTARKTDAGVLDGKDQFNPVRITNGDFHRSSKADLNKEAFNQSLVKLI